MIKMLIFNPEIPGLYGALQFRDFGIIKLAEIPGFRDPGIKTLPGIVYPIMTSFPLLDVT